MFPAGVPGLGLAMLRFCALGGVRRVCAGFRQDLVGLAIRLNHAVHHPFDDRSVDAA